MFSTNESLFSFPYGFISAPITAVASRTLFIIIIIDIIIIF